MQTIRPAFPRTSWRALVFLSVCLTSSLPAADVPARLVAGCKLDSLTVGTTTFQDVLVRSVSARSVMITYDGGMKSILLRELPPELQQRFGYDPEADRAQETTATVGQAKAEKQQQNRLEALRNRQVSSGGAGQGLSKIDQLLRSFGQTPDLAEAVDLRPHFNELGLWVKDQGHRPSCAVFAIVSALEYQSAEASGNPERFSEEYLYWATSKFLNRQNTDNMTGTGGSGEDQSDSGFTLDEVATALRTYGIPRRDRMSNQLAGKARASIPDGLVAEARQNNRTSVHAIPGHDGATLATNIILALNQGIPVPIGMLWPDAHAWRINYLDTQPTALNRRHAVTVVGYKCKTGRIEDTVFIFKNSWGPYWGQGGYGSVTYAYLSKCLSSAVVLEVQPPSK